VICPITYIEETIFNKGKTMKLGELQKAITECLKEHSLQDVKDTVDSTIDDFLMGHVYDDDDDNYDNFEPIRNTKRGWK